MCTFALKSAASKTEGEVRKETLLAPPIIISVQHIWTCSIDM